jgi:hypothetical protein
VPGYVTQRAVYAVAGATTGGSAGPPSAISTELGPAGIAGVAGGGLALLACAAAVLLYRRGRAEGSASQYSTLDVGGAMATISTPAGGGGAFGGSVQSVYSAVPAGGGGGGGGGFLGSLRSALGGAPSYASVEGKAPLAEEEDSGYADERASAYL